MGVGPKPIPIDKLDTPSLVEALNFMMRPEVQAAAQERGGGMKHVRITTDPLVHVLYTALLVCCGHANATRARDLHSEPAWCSRTVLNISVQWTDRIAGNSYLGAKLQVAGKGCMP